MSTYLTLAEATERVPVSAMTIRRAINSGELTGFKVAGKLLIRPDDLHAWVESRRVTADAPMPKPTRCESTTNNLLERAMRKRGTA